MISVRGPLMRLSVALAANVALPLVVGCGGTPTRTTEAPQVSTPPSLPEPAMALPAGARWLLIAAPRDTFASPALRRVFDVLMPQRRLAAWSTRYAVDPLTVDQVALGGYPSGVLLVARGGLAAPKAVRAVAAAMDATETEAESPRPLAVGLIGSERYLVAAVGDSELVLGQGAPEGWDEVFRYLDGAASEPPAASLSLAALRDLTATENAPLTLHLLEPLDLPSDTPIGVVLAGQKQMSATMSSAVPESIELCVRLSGDFPATIEDNLRALVQALSLEPLGAALGIGAAVESLQVEQHAGVVTVRVALPTERVVAGLEALFGPDLWKLIDAP